MIEQEYEDRIFLLEDALAQTWSLADFLWNCLETDGYHHGYPEMSRDTLDRLGALLPERTTCVHSMMVAGCRSCEETIALFKRRAEIAERARQRG